MSVRVSRHAAQGWLEVDIHVRLPDGTRHRERVKSPVQSMSGAKQWAEERERFLALGREIGPRPTSEQPAQVIAARLPEDATVIRLLSREIEMVRELCKRIEWNSGTERNRECPDCGAEKRVETHEPWCELAEMIRGNIRIPEVRTVGNVVDDSLPLPQKILAVLALAPASGNEPVGRLHVHKTAVSNACAELQEQGQIERQGKKWARGQSHLRVVGKVGN